MKMPVSDDTFVPSLFDRNDGENTNSGDFDGRRRKSVDRYFFLDSFHHLMLERFENQRKAEQQWMRRNDRRTSIRCCHNVSLQSPSDIVGSSSNIEIMDRSFQGSSSARRELLRLGRLYAISQRSQSTTLVSSSDNRFESPQAPILSPDKSVDTPDPTCLLDFKSNVSVVTPDEKDASTAGIGICYLLLARTNSLPISKSDNDNNINDEDDGSSFASYNSSVPHLQAASTRNSPGDNKGGFGHNSYGEEHDHGILNQCSSFCGAQMSLHEMEDQRQRQTHRLDVAQSGTLLKDALGQLDEKIVRSKTIPILIAIAAIFVSWRYILGWHNMKLTKYHSDLQAIQRSYWAIKSTDMAFIRDQYTRFTLLSKLGWGSVVDVYTNWRKDFDLLSCIIHHLLRLEIMHQEIKHRFWAVRDVLVVASNITLSVVVSFSQPLKSEQLSNTSHPFVPQYLNVMKFASPLASWSNNDYFIWALGNETVTIQVADAAKEINESSSPKFWRAPIGPPFVRHRLPVTRQRCIYSIPSLETWLEESSILTIPPLSELRESNENQPIFLHKHPSLLLDKTCLDSIAISLDMHKNMVTRPPKCSKYLPREPYQSITSVKRNYYGSSYLPGHSDDKDVFEDVDIIKLLHEFASTAKKELRKLLNRERRSVNNTAFEENPLKS